MLVASIVIAALTQILVSLFVFFRARHKLAYQLFFFISIALLGWALTNYLTIVFLQSPYLIFLVRIVMVFVVMQNTFFYLFARVFPDISWGYSKKWLIGYSAFSLVAVGAALSPFMFTSVEIESGLPAVTAGPAMLIFVLHAGFSIILGFKALFKKMHKSTGSQKNQLQILLFASFLIWVIVPITNFVITPLIKTTTFITLAPLYTFLFSSLIAYAMKKHKLFDIRFAAARATAYIFVLFTLLVIYATVVFSVTSILFRSSEVSLVQNLVYITIAIFLAFTYAPVKNFFDRMTNRLFLRDDYDIEEVVIDLGNITVREVDLASLEKKSQQVLLSSLRATYISFIIDPHKKIAGVKTRVSATGSVPEDLKSTFEFNKDIIEHLKLEHSYLERGSAKNQKTTKLMEKFDIDVIIRMKKTSELDGFVLVGSKSNGALYTHKDKQLLNTASDELALAIQNALRFEEIRAFNRTLQEKVDEATTKLRRTNAKLQQLDEAKDEFISMASHQLRTPLTSVKGYLSMVLEGDAGKLSANQKKLLEEAYAGSQRMVYLISDFLNVSRMKTGKFVLEYNTGNLAKLVGDEINQLRDTAARRSIELVYDEPEGLPESRFDENKIRQAIMNLTDNAIYYSKPGSKINIELYKKDEQLVFKVKDQGIGVPLKEQKDLFEKFYRATNARKVRPDGTGIGLFMIKKVVLAHGGAIVFESVENKGSTFGFTLPLKPSRQAAKIEIESPQPAEK